MLDDEHFYQRALDELRAEGPREALWIKALTATNGDLERAKLEYIKLRVKQLKNDSLRQQTASVSNAIKQNATRTKRGVKYILQYLTGSILFAAGSISLPISIVLMLEYDVLSLYIAPAGLLLLLLGITTLRPMFKKPAIEPDTVPESSGS